MNPASRQDDDLARRIAEGTDRCVRCGLCLPHCPTYALLRDEGDSPRGRISLMQGLVEGRLPASDAVVGHLDRCLDCRACEGVCPSRVPYGRLIDDIRTWLDDRAGRRSSPAGRADDLVGRLERPGSLRRLFALARLYQWSGLQWLLRRSGLLGLTPWRRLDALLPRIGRRFATGDHYPARDDEQGRVALFTGCLGGELDGRTLRSTVELLNRAGFSVTVPEGQACCGALARHGGRLDAARRLAEANLAAFDDPAIEAVVGVASGCSAMLADYPELLDGRRLPVVDVMAFLARHGDRLRFAPLERTVAVHTPCSQRLDRAAVTATRRLLERIPAIRLSALDSLNCCGAAGRYLIDEPEIADRLRDRQLDDLDRIGNEAGVLVSGNLGCALHLAAGLRARRRRLEVLHPVELLARQARRADGR